MTILKPAQQDYIRKLAEEGGQQVTSKEKADILAMVVATSGSNYWRISEWFEESLALLQEIRKLNKE